MNIIKINDKEIGLNKPCFIVAEIGLSHEGSLGIALSFIDAVADCGVDAVKFQIHIAEEEGTCDEKFRVNTFPQDRTRREYWERTSFNEEEWKKIKIYAERKGLIFICSPFSIKAVEILNNIGVSCFKMGSGEINNLPMLEKIAETKKTVFISTGMSDLNEIDNAVKFCKKFSLPLLLYQCVNLYPCPPEKIGLNMIEVFKNKYNIPVGLSDHSGRSAASLAAFVMGANSIEIHVTWHKECFGPDVPASLTIEELKRTVDDIRFLEIALKNKVDKNVLVNELVETRNLFMKSIVASIDLEKGCVIRYKDLAFKKPGNGILADNYKNLIGKRLIKNIRKDQMILKEDYE